MTEPLSPPILHPSPESFDRAADIIAQGGIVVVPTKSIYVLVCDAFQPAALARLRAVRHSPPDKPLTIVMDKTRVPEFAVLDERQRRIVDLFLPSPVSLWVSKKDHRLDAAVCTSPVIVVYYQDSEVGQLYQRYGNLLAISSSNHRHHPDAATIQEAVAYFGPSVDLYLDGGPPRGTKPSAHLDIRYCPAILRREAPHFPLQRIRDILTAHGLE